MFDAFRAGLEAFGKDVMEETEELSQSAAAAVGAAVGGVEHLPQHVSMHVPLWAMGVRDEVVS